MKAMVEVKVKKEREEDEGEGSGRWEEEGWRRTFMPHYEILDSPLNPDTQTD